MYAYIGEAPRPVGRGASLILGRYGKDGETAASQKRRGREVRGAAPGCVPWVGLLFFAEGSLTRPDSDEKADMRRKADRQIKNRANRENFCLVPIYPLLEKRYFCR